ncbi:hypothetical protein [Sphingomonas sp. CFBP 8764]|uniref:hypothetical protein n=1 Tax=Sphingomonas sp. CFBP 8764 TaxID=2775275 RepID=UPI001784B97E|nr:hypothetical protein [Sphingomonas sp. CFBP 8764]MBD8551294.1 hypothetical protein [Sphingomonas sp. CFBP 8764]
MADTPNFGFNPKPRFSVNHLTRYLSTTNASQRHAIIREAKFPRKIPVATYGQAKRDIQNFLSKGGTDIASLNASLDRLAAKAVREPDKRDEALRCIKALEAFKELYATKRWSKITFSPNSVDIPHRIGGVLINIRLDAQMYERHDDGSTTTGGVVIFLAQTAEARKQIDVRRRQVASLVLWGLEGYSQMEPLPRLCLSFDVFGQECVRAPDAKDRFRRDVLASCREAAIGWDGIAPPDGYDGPPWL